MVNINANPANSQYVAVIMPNTANLDPALFPAVPGPGTGIQHPLNAILAPSPLRPNIINNVNDWKNWQNWRVTLPELETATGLTFLNGIPNRSFIPTPVSPPILANELGTNPNPNNLFLTDPNLRNLTFEAIDRWREIGISESQLDLLYNVEIDISDLTSTQLANADTLLQTLNLDRDAAGHGWFIDSTPDDNTEFTFSDQPWQLNAQDANAINQMDLLTVLTHEMGHFLGLDHVDQTILDFRFAILD